MASNFSRVKILAIFQLLHTTWCFRFFLEFHNLMLDYLMTLKNLNKNAKNLLLFMRKLEVIKNYDGWEFERCKATKKINQFLNHLWQMLLLWQSQFYWRNLRKEFKTRSQFTVLENHKIIPILCTRLHLNFRAQTILFWLQDMRHVLLVFKHCVQNRRWRN